MIRQFPASALMITPRVRSRKTREDTGLKTILFFVNNRFESNENPSQIGDTLS